MTSARKMESYRGFDLVADQGQGKGMAWKRGSDRFEASGNDADVMLGQLRQEIDAAFPRVVVNLANDADRGDAFAEAYLEAFRRVVAKRKLPDSYRAMLRALVRAPGHQLDDEQLRTAAKFSSVSGVNLHFGTLGLNLFHAMMDLGHQLDLPVTADGKPCHTCAIARQIRPGDRTTPGIWQLYPETVAALRALELD